MVRQTCVSRVQPVRVDCRVRAARAAVRTSGPSTALRSFRQSELRTERSDASKNMVGIRRPYQSKVPADDRARPEGVRDLRAVRRLVQIAERLVVLAV